MTDDDAWEAWCAAHEDDPFICNECSWACEASDVSEIEAHRDEHLYEWLRSQCPIPPPEPAPRKPVVETKETEDVPF